MKNKSRKVLKALLLTLTIVLMYSINVSAANGQASIGNKNYSTVQKALSAVKNGQTIKLNQNVTLKTTLVSKKNVTYTFDMNKHKITSKVPDVSKGSFDIRAGKVTLMNGTLTGPVLVQKGAELIVKSGNYEQIANGGKTTFKNGKVITKKYAALCNYGGTFLIKKADVKAKYNSVYAESGTVTINDGVFRNYDDSASYPVIYSEKATVNLKGGMYANSYWKKQAAIVYNKNGKITISGGRYTGTCASIQNSASMNIKGGTFLSENSPILQCEPRSTTTITGGELTSGSTISAIELAQGRNKFSMTGGTLQTYSAMAFIICHGDDKNVTLDKKKVNLVGQNWTDISVQ